MRLRSVFFLFRWWILLAIGLVVVENVAWIIEPSLFGPVIDALIDNAATSSWAPALHPLLLWIGVFAINSSVGAFRRAYDQNIYLSIYTNLATRVTELSRSRGLTTSRTAARTQLAREFITFVQYRMPEILEQVIAIGGSLIGLSFFDYRIAAACAVVTIPLTLVTVLYAKKVVPLQATVHDGMEEMYEVFEQQDVGAIDLDSFSTGNIYSIVAYVWTFVTSSEYLPELMESWTSLQDITARLRGEREPALAM